jgi:hypothetical protein
MNCRRADQLFSAAWEDELTLVEREALESHMAACAACRVAYDEFVRVMEAVQGLPKVEAGAEFSQGVWSRIRAVESPRALRVRLVWSWASFRPALAAAASLVVVGGAVLYVHRILPQGSGPNPSPVTEQRAAPSPVAMAPAEPSSQPAEKPVAPPAKVAKREAVKTEVASAKTEVASASTPKFTDDSGSGAPAAAAPLASDLHLRGGRAEAGMLLANKGVAVAKRDSTTPSDTLFDHSYDVEFALDPVRLSKSAKGKLTPSRPMPTEVQGKPAKVTF